MFSPLFENATVPVGGAVIPLGASISTVKVTGWPSRAGLLEDMTCACMHPAHSRRTMKSLYFRWLRRSIIIGRNCFMRILLLSLDLFLVPLSWAEMPACWDRRRPELFPTRRHRP